MKTFIACSVSIALTAAAWAAEPMRGYHLGNSLTWDSRPRDMEDVYTAEGYDAAVGYHIACARPAHYIAIENPDWTCVTPAEPFGMWQNALPNYQWDYLSIQSHTGATGVEEFQGIGTLINSTLSNPANADTTFYIYQAWGRQSDVKTYRELWEMPYTDFSGSMQFREDYFEGLYQQVSDAFPQADIGMIPVGEVLSRIDTYLINGAVPQFESAYDLYRDPVHMDYNTGRYVAHATVLATILNKPPEQIPITAFPDTPPEFKALADQVIWDTLTGQPEPPPPPKPEEIVYLYDPFDTTATPTAGHYVAGIPLNDSANRTVGMGVDWSGEGRWAGEWDNGEGLVAREGSLVYETPEAYIDTQDGKLANRPGGTSQMTRRAVRTDDDKVPSGVVFFSFLGQWDGFSGTQEFGFTDSENVSGGRYEILVNSNGAKVRLFGDSSTDSPYAPLTAGQTHLFVGRMEIDHSLTVWIDPDPAVPMDELTEDDYMALIETSDMGGSVTRPVDLWMMSPNTISDTLDFEVDELRIGNAWDEVLAVEIRGDFNGDGALNGLDIPGFKAALADPDAWTDNVARNAHRLGDFNGDGAFNGLDIPAFKTALAGAAVPEPVSIALVTAGMLGVLRRRRVRM
jgi:hypothetical protein